MFTHFTIKSKVQFVAIVIALIVSFISFLSITPITFAQTSPTTTASELQAMIEKLMTQIALLQGGTGTTTPVATSRFVKGESVDVTTAVRVRSTAGLTGAILGTQTSGLRGTIIDGPIRADGYTWWKVDYMTGPDGWTVEAWLVSNTADGISAIQKRFHQITKGTETNVAAGKQNANIAKIAVPAANIDRYINKVAMFVDAEDTNTQTQPWLAFKTISLWKNGIKIGTKDISNPSLWRSLRTGDQTESQAGYEVTLFEGNQKISAGITYATDLSVSVSPTAKAGDVWSFGIPEQGVVVWSSITGAVNYGHQVERVVVTISGSTTAALGSYVGYMNDAIFIQTNDISRADALTNCKLNATDNPTALVRCTWNGVEIFATTPVATTPGKNAFACDRTAGTSTIADGKLACYGMWDMDDAFGGDKDMCGAYGVGKKGCVIETQLCSSGKAKAVTYFTGATIPTAKIKTISKNLETAADIVKVNVEGMWEYTCLAPVTTGPGKNAFACDRAVATPIANGKLACYGIWDEDDSFGGDKDMCGSYGAPEKGCIVSAPVCESGKAKANLYYTGETIPTAKLTTISTRLKTTPEIATRDIRGLWEYTCVIPVVSVPKLTSSSTISTASTSGAVLGAATDILTEIGSTLSSIIALLRTVK